jgi:hypothetical protein
MNYENINYELQLNQNTDNVPSDSNSQELINPIMEYERLIFQIIEEKEKE